MTLRPLCAESIRWAASQMSQELVARDLDYGSEGEVAELARSVNKRLSKEWLRLEKELRDHNRRCFYFGCWDDAGHFWHDKHGSYSKAREEAPFGYPDGNWQPDNGQFQGPAALRHHKGWTILAWWDRTEDTRPGSCSALVFEGELGFEAMVALLKKRFRRVYDRRPLTKWLGKCKGGSK